MLPQTFNAKWIKGPKMANASHQHDGQDGHEQAQGSVKADAAWQDQETHARAMEIWQQQQAAISETEADVGKWHPPMSVIRQKIDVIRKGLDDLEAAL
jgi:hypothetical protein